MTTYSPLISQQHVRMALDSFLYSGFGKQNPLLKLALVDELLTTPDFPSTIYERELALQQILVMFIEHELHRHRQVYGLQSPDTNHTLQEVYEQIDTDGKTTNPELLGWSWLYYHYVRVDLSISHTLFSYLIFVDERTLRRYQQHGLRRLTERLSYEEWNARIRQRKYRLLSQLSEARPLHFCGREKQMERVQARLTASAAGHISITGVAGIGKTAFLQTMVRWQLETQDVEFLVWIDRPLTIASIWNQVVHNLSVPNNVQALREFLLSHLVIIALDDVRGVEDEPEQLETLLNNFSAATVYSTSRGNLHLPTLKLLVSLSDISYDDASSLIRTFVAAYYPLDGLTISDGDIAAIWSVAGGNPARIKQAVDEYFEDYESKNGHTRGGKIVSDEQKILDVMRKCRAKRARVIEFVTTPLGISGAPIPFDEIAEIRRIADEIQDTYPDHAIELRKDADFLDHMIEHWGNIFLPTDL